MRRVILYTIGLMFLISIIYIGRELYQYIHRTSCPKEVRTSSLSLPTYPNSEQEKVKEDLREGYYTKQVQYVTKDSPNEVINFYKSHLKTAGWEFVEQQGDTWLVYRESTALPLYGFQLSITPLPASTKVEILFDYSPCIKL